MDAYGLANVYGPMSVMFMISQIKHVHWQLLLKINVKK